MSDTPRSIVLPFKMLPPMRCRTSTLPRRTPLIPASLPKSAARHEEKQNETQHPTKQLATTLKNARFVHRKYPTNNAPRATHTLHSPPPCTSTYILGASNGLAVPAHYVRISHLFVLVYKTKQEGWHDLSREIFSADKKKPPS